jgi:hypothetical protein
MEEHTTNLFGVPVPSDNKVFLTFIVIHIFLGLTCVISGVVAMLSKKAKGPHSKAGQIYYWAMTALFVTVIITSVMRWPHNIHLLIVGSFAYFLTYYGQWLTRTRKPNWTRLHTICMGSSYVLLITGFYVDNGKNLPFWNQFPLLFFWLFPSVIGIPIIIYTFIRHPLNRRHRINKD